ncbi:MAG: hypothetical protein ABR884_04165 [Minisyncoccia bacterium]
MKRKIKFLGGWAWDAFVLCIGVAGYALVIGIKLVLPPGLVPAVGDNSLKKT